jgi:hypothetical protein
MKAGARPAQRLLTLLPKLRRVVTGAQPHPSFGLAPAETPSHNAGDRVTGTRYPGRHDADDVRRDAGATGVAADGGPSARCLRISRQRGRRGQSKSASWADTSFHPGIKLTHDLASGATSLTTARARRASTERVRARKMLEDTPARRQNGGPMAVRYFCDRCENETEAGELRIVKLIFPPDPPVTLDVCARCATSIATHALGKRPRRGEGRTAAATAGGTDDKEGG